MLETFENRLKVIEDKINEITFVLSSNELYMKLPVSPIDPKNNSAANTKPSTDSKDEEEDDEESDEDEDEDEEEEDESAEQKVSEPKEPATDSEEED